MKSCAKSCLLLHCVTFTVVQALRTSPGALQHASHATEETLTISRFPPERRREISDTDLAADATEKYDLIDESSVAGIPNMSDIPLVRNMSGTRKRAMMLHLQKMGGSLMCDLAHRREHVVQPEHCCNWEHRDFGSLAPPTCAERVAHFAKGGFTYGQIERPFRKEDHCPNEFIYFTMMRDPVSAAKSIINYHPPEGGHAKLLGCVEAKRQNCSDHLRWKDTPHFFDNYMVRFILGSEINMLPLGEITDEHAQAAIKVLEQFDLVTTLEGFKTAGTQRSLNAVLGWSLATEQPSKVNASPNKYKFTPEQETRLRALLQHDYTVYNRFTQKQ